MPTSANATSSAIAFNRFPGPSFKSQLYGATALATAGGKLVDRRDGVTLSSRALSGLAGETASAIEDSAQRLVMSGWNALSNDARKALAASKAKAATADPNRVPAALQRPLILAHGIRSGADTFTAKAKEGQPPNAVDYLTRNKSNIFGGTIVGVDAQGRLLVVPRPTAKNPHPEPTTDVPVGANLFTIDLNKGSNTIDQNGGELKEAIEAIAQAQDAANPGTRSKVDIMGWSHGGLDGLRAAQLAGDRVAHLTTLGSPFKGAVVAPFHPILRAIETLNPAHLFGPDPIRDELSPGSPALRRLQEQREQAKGLKVMSVSGLDIGPGGGDGVIAPESSRLDGAIQVNAHGYAHTRMHNSPDVLDQVLNFNSGGEVQTDLRGPGTILDLVF